MIIVVTTKLRQFCLRQIEFFLRHFFSPLRQNTFCSNDLTGDSTPFIQKGYIDELGRYRCYR
jgi:hypothetical protein